MFISFYFNNLSLEEESIIKFLAVYLSSGSTSKLFEVLRNKLGSSYSNDSDLLDFRGENGLFYIFSNINNSLMIDSLREVLKILQELKEKEILEEDIKKVKKIFETSNLFQINNPNFLMLYHGKKYLFGKDTNIISEIDIVSKLDAKTIKDFCNTFLIKKNMSVFIFGYDIEQSDIAKVINEFN